MHLQFVSDVIVRRSFIMLLPFFSSSHRFVRKVGKATYEVNDGPGVIFILEAERIQSTFATDKGKENGVKGAYSILKVVAWGMREMCPQGIDNGTAAERIFFLCFPNPVGPVGTIDHTFLNLRWQPAALPGIYIELVVGK